MVILIFKNNVFLNIIVVIFDNNFFGILVFFVCVFFCLFFEFVYVLSKEIKEDKLIKFEYLICCVN